MTVDAERSTHESEALQDLAAFPFVEALYGRRSRRFALGDEIPDGPLAYRAARPRHRPLHQRARQARRDASVLRRVGFDVARTAREDVALKWSRMTAEERDD